ncbi:nitrate regulatory protein [Pseudomonas matsuisoli]|uniref:Nitrate regulatory protein n=2 Tax=Pseudomonas matsuisoli TaxID=1515666 RepID=A0A917URG6_9PSED|nr:nitrate regulatory protein [Pseudomonas matsuisoli]
MPDTHMPPALRFMLAARRCELQGLESLALTGELVTLISQLVHALQKERGYSNIYLAGSDPGRLPALDGHTAEAQAMEVQVRECFERFDLDAASATDRARLFNRIAYVLHGLDDLPGLRRRIRDQALSSAQATVFFTRLIGGLLAVVFEAADTALDPVITRALVAMFNFMQGKELAGQERAAGVAGFSAGHFTPEQLDHVRHLIEAQERCFDVFTQFTDRTAQANWQALQYGETMAQIAQLRLMAQRTSAEAQVAPSLCDVWFDLNTQRIDAMKDIEAHLASDLLDRCQQAIKVAKADLDNHRSLLKRLAGFDKASGRAVLFNVQGSTLDAGPQDGVGSHLNRSILDLMQEQNTRLQSVSDELREARQTLDERRLVERAKKALMKEYHLSESDAYTHLQNAAMQRGMRLVDVAKSVLDQVGRKGSVRG